MRSWALLWLVVGICVASTACIEDSLVPCGAAACAPDDVCTAGGCAKPDQVEVCASVAENAECSSKSTTHGHCVGGACRAEVCGNGRVEFGEACDDGNVDPGDGCAANCDSIETCGNGVADFANGEQCDDGNGLDDDDCHSDCKIPRCGDGTVDAVQNGEGCDAGIANANTPDAACRTNCQPARCGDAVLDSGEACDDGDQAGGDGCSGDCLSTEVCGNGVIDSVNDELCDNVPAGLSADSCTSVCSLEDATWTLPKPAWVGRQNAFLAYDSFRKQLVMFGGVDTINSNTLFRDTWLWDGGNWKQAFPKTLPPARAAAAGGYDPVRHRVVMFAGTGLGGALLGDTWEWNGLDWVLRATTGPSMRYGAAAAYFAPSGKLVLFGGGDNDGNVFNDTWEWDGVAWTDISNVRPPGRAQHGMAFDTTSNSLVMFGGIDGSLSLRGDTWVMSGSGWAASTTGATITPRWHVAMASVPGGGVAMIGGASPAPSSQVYFWTQASGWVADSNVSRPTARYGASAAPDSRNAVIVVGGTNDVTMLADTWRYTGTWGLSTGEGPVQTGFMQLAYDHGRARIVGYILGETWEWDGQIWKRNFVAGPGSRSSYGFAYDEKRKQVVLYGGSSDTKTWLYDGAAWTSSAVASPGQRSFVAMAYDVERDRVVLFGSSTQNDTWLWDGSAWSSVTPAHIPPGSVGASLAYDRARGRAVLYIPVGNGQLWEWNGIDWTNVTPPTMPPMRYYASLAYQPAWRRVVLFGGQLAATYYSDLWGWDGAQWKQALVASSPTGRQSSAMAFDGNGDLIVYGGLTGIPTNETWRFRFSSISVPSERCIDGLDVDGDALAGCSDPDCWARCTPYCSPLQASCDLAQPRCGDTACNGNEDYVVCPADCVAP